MQSHAVGLIAAAALVALTGCPPGTNPANQAPTANAGPDQTVAPGAAVTLSASGTDPDNDTLTFAWEGVGNSITLTNANTATATFTAPATQGDLTFRVTVTDTGGLSDTDEVVVSVTTTPTTSKTLYVSNIGAAAPNDSVLGFKLDQPSDINGNFAPISNLSGAQTNIDNPRGLAIDNDKNLLVGNDGNNSIVGFGLVTNPTSLNGNVQPLRNVQGAGSAVNTLRGIAHHSGTPDLLYVSDDTAGTSAIRIFAGASADTFNGNLAPVRTITSTGNLTNPRGIFVDTTTDTLFVANESAPARVLVFTGISTKPTGNHNPDRQIGTATLNAARDVFVSGNNLLVVDNGDQQVLVFDKNTNNPTTAQPSSTLTVQGASNLNSVIVDSSDGVGYISDRIGNRIYFYTNIVGRNGVLPPDGQLGGATTLLNQPYSLIIGQ